MIICLYQLSFIAAFSIVYWYTIIVDSSIACDTHIVLYVK